MKGAFGLFLVAFTSISIASASVIKKTTIDGQQYSCRPSNLEPECNLNTDLGFVVAVAGAAADATICLNDVQNDQSKVKDCFLQKRLKNYAKRLDIQMISRACWGVFVSRCAEISACPDDPDRKCGHLGVFLQTLEDAKLNHLFSEKDGMMLCQSLTE